MYVLLHQLIDFFGGENGNQKINCLLLLGPSFYRVAVVLDTYLNMIVIIIKWTIYLTCLFVYVWFFHFPCLNDIFDKIHTHFVAGVHLLWKIIENFQFFQKKIPFNEI